MKILIAVPTFENIYPDTFKSIYDLDKAGHDLGFEFVEGMIVLQRGIRLLKCLWMADMIMC